MKLKALLSQSIQILQQADIPSPEVDARLLILYVLDWPASAFLTRPDEMISGPSLQRIEQLIQQRAKRIPLQHLLGQIEWGNIQLKTDTRALIPRPETEWLFKLGLDVVQQWPKPEVLDVGTGTGALALAIKAAYPQAEVWASDLSPKALELAKENAILNNLDIQFVQSDLLQNISGSFDLIISNPPYLPENDELDAQPEVKYDPTLALYAGADGLDLARPLAEQAQQLLNKNGVLLLELDPRNTGVLASELSEQGWYTQVLADLLGRKRFLYAVYAR